MARRFPTPPPPPPQLFFRHADEESSREAHSFSFIPSGSDPWGYTGGSPVLGIFQDGVRLRTHVLSVAYPHTCLLLVLGPTCPPFARREEPESFGLTVREGAGRMTRSISCQMPV